MEFRRADPRLRRTLPVLLLCLCMQGQAQNCSSSSCLSGGTCQQAADGFICLCPTQPQIFTGPKCEFLYDACSEFDCPKSHTCQGKPGSLEYQCLCRTGFNCTANDCDQNPCPFPNAQCSDEGETFTCKCQNGYGGFQCQEKAAPCTPNPCDNQAQCVETADGYTCVCPFGYTGQHCENTVNNCASNPCQNDAICMNKGNKYMCFCVPGFQGHHCEIDINECASAPCQNNGTCVNLMDEYECECATGYTGANCETEIDECQSDPCQNGATCQDYIGHFLCKCPAGYDGEVCQHDIDECQSQPCRNGGVCVDALNRFYCNCTDTGFEGEMCEIDILECASNPCVNNATCVEGVKGYTCVCLPGYSGVSCELDVDECAENPCLNGALCLQRSNESFYGTEPEFNGEFSHADAAGYACRCLPGFTGENCSVDIDDCASNHCQNGGKCIDLINRFRCECAAGYTGFLCVVNINECENNPCQNGATCLDEVADYVCACPLPGLDGITWGGKNCSVVLVGCSNHSCQNNAKCVPTYEMEIHGHTCQCQPGFYGKNCSISTTFSFPSGGFIFHDLNVENSSQWSIEENYAQLKVQFRTTLPNLILVYRGDEDVCLLLEVYNGLLEVSFKNHNFSSRLIIDEQPVDDGHWHTALVSLHSSLQLMLLHDGCSNGSCFRMKDFGDDHDVRLPESFSKVYIGGLAQDSLLSNTRSKKNFTGCMQDLKIDFDTFLPQHIRQESSFDMELGCNKTDWCNPNPCHHESLCIDLWIGHKCDCVRPYTGPTCLQEHTSGTFFHEMVESYASFAITRNIGGSFNVSAFIRTLKPDGLLLHISNGSADLFTVYLKSGRIHIAVMLGKTVTFSEQVSDGKKHMINILVKEGLVSVSGQTKEDLGRLPALYLSAGGMVHVGGMPPGGNINQWGGYFKGCLQDVRINNHYLDFFTTENEDVALYPDSISNVTKGCVSDDTCNSSPCKNDGTCAVTWNEFTCNCSASFTGATCEDPVWCHRSPCPEDSTCEDIPGGYTCVHNASFEEENSVVFMSNFSSDIQEVTSVSMVFRTRDTNAVLLQASKDQDHISIIIQDGHLHVYIQSGNSVEQISYHGEVKVSNALWHNLLLKMKDTRRVPPQWILHYDDTDSILGSAGSLSFLTQGTAIVLGDNYTGCLGQVSIGGFYIPFADQIFPQPFVRKSPDLPTLGCRGADVCSGTQCLHGGTCNDEFNEFSCSCAEGWEGAQCEVNIDDCKSQPCAHGACEDLESSYRCICSSGYTGKNCETNVDDCQHHRCLNGGTCLDGLNNYTCQCPPTYAGDYCQWPYPPEKCGINVTCLNAGKCKGGIWGANCTCLPGFKGKRCEINIDDCESSPCLNGGSCQDSVNNFKCICNASYSGVRCEKPRIIRKPQASSLVGSAIGTGMLFILLFVIAIIMITMRKKRATQGTYSPSRQEKEGARVEMWNVLKLPPTERLI